MPVSLDHLAALAAARPRPPEPGSWSISAAAGGRTSVRLYGYIGKWRDVESKAFADALDAIGDGGIDLHVNSGGGDFFDGVAVYTALRSHASDVDVYIDALAASAASLVAMAGDRILIEKPAKMMIHRASAVTWGTGDEHRQLGSLLDEVDDTQAEMYADRAGGTVKEWLARMDATTWYSAREAVRVGLADEVIGQAKDRGEDGTAAAAALALRDQTIRARARAAMTRGRR